MICTALAPDVEMRFDEASHVAILEWSRPPNNFFDVDLIESLLRGIEDLADVDCRCVVLQSLGKHFCAGRDFSVKRKDEDSPANLYAKAVAFFHTPIPIVAAVQGAAVGGGLGLAMAADFRVASASSRFVANFARLGYFPGFGLTVTLPRALGHQHAANLLYRGERVKGVEAHAIGLADKLAPDGHEQEVAYDLAAEIAVGAPESIFALKRVLRGTLADEVRAATDVEASIQQELMLTRDFREGVDSTRERRSPQFTGS